MQKVVSPMDNYPIKNVAFGGFNKQDVVRYIEQAATEASVAQKALEEGNSALRDQIAALMEKADALQAQMDEIRAEKEELSAALDQERALREELEALKPAAENAQQLQKEIDALRPDAQAYAQFREQLGTIECEARKRAGDLELATAAQLRQTVDLFRQQYQILMSTFESTASHVTGELRKIEVSLSLLPRAMDQAGSELNTLAAQLKKED